MISICWPVQFSFYMEIIAVFTIAITITLNILENNSEFLLFERYGMRVLEQIRTGLDEWNAWINKQTYYVILVF